MLADIQLLVQQSMEKAESLSMEISADADVGVTVPKEDILLLMRDGCPELYTPRDVQKVPAEASQENTRAAAAAQANEAQVADGSLSPQTRATNRRRKSISEGLTEDQAFASFMTEIETVSVLCAD